MQDDDWLYPKMSSDGWTAPAPKEQWIIQRERTIVCSWIGDGPPREWATWMGYDSREERDKELKRLRETTSWHLRPYYQPLHGRGRVEDEEADLVHRLAAVRQR